MKPEDVDKWRCPNCGADSKSMTVVKSGGMWDAVTVECQCGEHGKPAYFTPAEPQVERIISRQIDVDPGRDDRAHVKAMTAAMDLFVRAASEEGLDIRWETLRLVAARAEDGAGITFVAVVKTWERRHAKDASDLKALAMTKAEHLYEMGFIKAESVHGVRSGDSLTFKTNPINITLT